MDGYFVRAASALGWLLALSVLFGSCLPLVGCQGGAHTGATGAMDTGCARAVATYSGDLFALTVVVDKKTHGLKFARVNDLTFKLAEGGELATGGRAELGPCSKICPSKSGAQCYRVELVSGSACLKKSSGRLCDVAP